MTGLDTDVVTQKLIAMSTIDIVNVEQLEFKRLYVLSIKVKSQISIDAAIHSLQNDYCPIDTAASHEKSGKKYRDMINYDLYSYRQYRVKVTKLKCVSKERSPVFID